MWYALILLANAVFIGFIFYQYTKVKAQYETLLRTVNEQSRVSVTRVKTPIPKKQYDYKTRETKHKKPKYKTWVFEEEQEEED